MKSVRIPSRQLLEVLEEAEEEEQEDDEIVEVGIHQTCFDAPAKLRIRILPATGIPR